MADPQPKPTRKSEPTRALGEADDVRLYLEAAAREPLLTKEEEVELAMGIEHGEEAEEKLKAGRLKSEVSIRKAKEAVRKGHAARQRFIRANLRLVVSIARKYQGQGLPFLDLIQEGNIGLMRAVELFDCGEDSSSPRTPRGGSARPSPGPSPIAGGRSAFRCTSTTRSGS